MAESNQTQLIEKLISFIKNERELYGDFSIPESTDTSPEASEPQQLQQKLGCCGTLAELETLCSQTEVLKTDLKNTKLVFGEGNSKADLMIIGEAPGADEDKIGKPFVGRAGKLLTEILKAINFERDEVFITNILKHRPPGNRDPLPEERAHSLPFLHKQIELVDPKLILALGKVSAQTLLNSTQSLTKLRGTFHAYNDKIELLVTYHPAALLRRKQWKRPTWEDVQLLRKRYDELRNES